jgi:c-di-GMP-binding flagellar brake protein YcgR
MNYARYFKTEQKVFLIDISPERELETFQSFTGHIAESGGDFLDITFPYPSVLSDVFPFAEGMSFKFTSESFGVGVQLSARFGGRRPGGLFRFHPTGNLELFQRRQIPRVDLNLPFAQLRKRMAPVDLQGEWKRQCELIQLGGQLPVTLESQSINLSAGGFRSQVQGDAGIAELCLCYLDISDGEPVVCAIAEVVWTGEQQPETVCGCRFITISKNDQQRLSRFVLERLTAQGKSPSAFTTNWELLDRMIFSDI